MLQLTGMVKIVKPAELNFTQSGTEVANLTVVSNRRYKKGDETVDEATFVRLTAWGQKAKFLADFAKETGLYLAINATLSPEVRVWENAEGKPMAGYEATINEVEIAWPKRAKAEDTVEEDQIPF